MKKIILALVLSMAMLGLSAQVMGATGVRNTLWTGFGNPNSSSRDATFYGFTDTLQARVDIAQFTMEGMINWGLFEDFDANGSRSFVFTDKTPFYAANRFSDADSSSRTNALTDAYYVNFLYHPVAGLDIGAGTRLDWNVGPAPACSDFYWGKDAHIKEGGLKDGYPGTTDVAGFVYYPNSYARTAVGARYSYKDMFEIGFAIPSGTYTGGFAFNTGFRLKPLSIFALSAAYEGAGRSEGDLYVGLEIFAQKNLTINAYYAMDRLGGNDNDGVNGFGLSAYWGVKGTSLVLTPEFGLTFYQNDDYTNAFYVGSGVDYYLTKAFSLGGYMSFAWGAENKYWHDSNTTHRLQHLGAAYQPYSTTNEWNGGAVFDIRPKLNFAFNSNNDITLYGEYQQRTRYTGAQTSSWAAGMYWTYRR